MTDMASSARTATGTKIYLYVSLTIIAAIVLVPLMTTALGGFKDLGDLRTNPFGLPAAGYDPPLRSRLDLPWAVCDVWVLVSFCCRPSASLGYNRNRLRSKIPSVLRPPSSDLCSVPPHSPFGQSATGCVAPLR